MCGKATTRGVAPSRAARRCAWTRELVGTITLAEFADSANLHDELICLIWQAIVGTSRLPLTSVEAPLPGFAFGQLHYVYCADAGETPSDSWEQLLVLSLQPDRAWPEPHKIFEFVLRAIAPDELPRFAELFLQAHPHGWAIGEVAGYWGRMFNDVSLSPYAHFVDNALTVLDLLVERQAIRVGERTKVLSRLLLKLGTHLTAYDLVTFHHRGANYPDALLLDTVLKRYLHVIERFPDRFLGNELKARVAAPCPAARMFDPSAIRGPSRPGPADVARRKCAASCRLRIRACPTNNSRRRIAVGVNCSRTIR